MAGNHLTEFTDQNFEEQVLKSDKPVLVDFWATWCGPCRMFAATVEAVAHEYADRAKVGKVNVDENMPLSSRYRITGIPALLLFKDGQVKEQLTGVQSKEAVIKMLERHIPASSPSSQPPVSGCTQGDVTKAASRRDSVPVTSGAAGKTVQ